MSAISERQAADTTRGIVFIVLASLSIPIADGLVKSLAGRLPVLELIWLRYGLQTTLLLPIVLHLYGSRVFRPNRPFMQLFRALSIGGGAVCFFNAVIHIPLADAVAVFFVQPFIITALSPIVLGERVGIWRWSAVVTGFLGALLIIRPSFEGINVGTLYALGSGMFYSSFILTTRRMAGGSDPPMMTNFLTGLIVTLLITPLVPLAWVTPSESQWFTVFWIGVIGGAFSLFIVLAYENADASQLAPFNYLELVAATAVGFIMFGDLPDALTWLGMAIIIASGLLIAWRERRLERRIIQL